MGNSMISYDFKPCFGHTESKENHPPNSETNVDTNLQTSSLLCSALEAPIEFDFENNTIGTFNECAIIQSGLNEVILVGGKNGRNKLNRTLWKMELKHCYTEPFDSQCLWKAVDMGSVKPRIRPICFRLRDNIYIAGGQTLNESDECMCVGEDYYLDLDQDGIQKCFVRNCNSKNKWTSLLCCDRYNVLQEKYYESVHHLPYSINDVDKIVTSADETFAIITRKNTGTCLVFTEEKGYQELPNSIIDENPHHPWGLTHPSYKNLRSDQRILFRIS